MFPPISLTKCDKHLYKKTYKERKLKFFLINLLFVVKKFAGIINIVMKIL